AAGVEPKMIVDSLVITPVQSIAPTNPIVASVSPSSRLTAIQQQNGWLADSATLTITGTDANTAAWTVSARKAHTSLNTTSGTGSATIGWRRRLNGLAAGTYVDTITVTVAA